MVMPKHRNPYRGDREMYNINIRPPGLRNYAHSYSFTCAKVAKKMF